MNHPNTTRFNPEELERYSRHFTLPHIGIDGQQRLKNARVLCVGAGGLGSPLLLYLAAAGVGTLGIVDDDVVDLTNLQRQLLYTTDDLARKKTIAAKQRLTALNAHNDYIIHDQRLTSDNAQTLIANYDIVVDGTDSLITRYLINDQCVQLKKPYVYASVSQHEGLCGVYSPDAGPCYRCLYPLPPPPESIASCAQAGVLGVVPGLLGTIQATEVIKWILGIDSSLIGHLLHVDVLTMQFQQYSFTKNPDCLFYKIHPTLQTNLRSQHDADLTSEITCKEFRDLQQQDAEFQLIDVREPHEYAICNLGGLLIPLRELPHRLNELDPQKHTIVHCKLGMRGQQATTLLRQAGFSEVANLTGGIMAWIDQIDGTMVKY